MNFGTGSWYLVPATNHYIQHTLGCTLSCQQLTISYFVVVIVCTTFLTYAFQWNIPSITNKRTNQPTNCRDHNIPPGPGDQSQNNGICRTDEHSSVPPYRAAIMAVATHQLLAGTINISLNISRYIVVIRGKYLTDIHNWISIESGSATAGVRYVDRLLQLY